MNGAKETLVRQCRKATVDEAKLNRAFFSGSRFSGWDAMWRRNLSTTAEPNTFEEFQEAILRLDGGYNERPQCGF